MAFNGGYVILKITDGTVVANMMLTTSGNSFDCPLDFENRLIECANTGKFVIITVPTGTVDVNGICSEFYWFSDTKIQFSAKALIDKTYQLDISTHKIKVI